MKNLTLLLCAFLIALMAGAQTQRDVITLKNGSMIKGIIIEQSPPTQLKIQTSDGNIFVYTYDQIEKITKEDITSSPLTTSNEKFTINRPFGKSTYQGKQLRKMSGKELKGILSQDPIAYSKYKGGSAMSFSGMLIFCVGSGLILYGTLQEANSYDSYGSSNSYGSSKSSGSDGTLSNVGLGIMVVSLPFSIAGGSMQKKGIRTFNNHPLVQYKTRISFYPWYSLEPTSRSGGIGFRANF